MVWKSVSITTSASLAEVWKVYKKFEWDEWDHDIESMTVEKAEDGLKDGNKVHITMVKGGKTHVATLSDVKENVCFTYIVPMFGCTLVATHNLEQGDGVKGTRITHTFDFTGGLLRLVFRWLTADYVQTGLEKNTAALKALVEGAPK
jgi:hypothetical protein